MFTIHKFDDVFSVKIYHIQGVNKHVSFYCMLDGKPTARTDLTKRQAESLKEYLKENFPLHYNLVKGMPHD